MAETRVLSIVVDCRTVSDFVHRFRELWDGESLLVPSIRSRPAGSRWRFAVRSHDGQRFLGGRCRITATYPERAGPLSVPAMRLRILALTPDTELVYARLISAWAEWLDTTQVSQFEDELQTAVTVVGTPITVAHSSNEASGALPTTLAEPASHIAAPPSSRRETWRMWRIR